MRAWIAVLLTAIVGVGAGVGSAYLRIERCPWAGGGLTPVRDPSAPVPVRSGPQPRVKIDSDEFDFGTLEINTPGSHKFTIENVGEAPLVLSPGQTSCKCTLSDLAEKTSVPPGGKVEVTVSWKSKGLSGPYRQTATVHTNDPERERVVLTIDGRFSVAAKAVPGELVFSRVLPGEPATGSVQLFGYRSETLKPEGFTWDDQSIAEFFEAKFVPLSEDQIKQEAGATSGSLLEITVKSGLPMGPFQQRISVATNLKESPTIEIPIRGKVASEIAIVGPGWDESNDMLVIGTVSSREGAKRTLLIMAGGPHGKDIQLKSVEVVPDLLKAELGTPKPIRDGKVTQVPLTITIPPGSPPANHLGSEQGKLGRITIETNHPRTPQLRIFVRFAIEG